MSIVQNLRRSTERLEVDHFTVYPTQKRISVHFNELTTAGEVISGQDHAVTFEEFIAKTAGKSEDLIDPTFETFAISYTAVLALIRDAVSESSDITVDIKRPPIAAAAELAEEAPA